MDFIGRDLQFAVQNHPRTDEDAFGQIGRQLCLIGDENCIRPVNHHNRTVDLQQVAGAIIDDLRCPQCPAFVKDACIGCLACRTACPYGAIKETKKEIGKIYTGKNYNVNLVSGELKLGELASGEVVAEVRKYSDKINEKVKAGIMVIDSSPGIGCPVIASLVGTDYIVAVTEPTPSALFDLKRVLYLANHFGIQHGIVINKFDHETHGISMSSKHDFREFIVTLNFSVTISNSIAMNFTPN